MTASGAEIVKLFNKLQYRYQMLEVWQDAITMIACAISNAVDGRFREEREKLYLQTAKKYNHDEMEIFTKIFAEIVIQLDKNPEQDLLGELYMKLDLGSHWAGQFFTPYSLCQAMSAISFQEIQNPDDVKPVSVFDCACGAGATLISALHEYRRSISKTGLNPQNYICAYAQDISHVTALMCYIQISMLGYAAKVKVGDSLCNPMTDSDNGSDIWYTPMWFSDVWSTRRAIERMKGVTNENLHNISLPLSIQPS